MWVGSFCNDTMGAIFFGMNMYGLLIGSALSVCERSMWHTPCRSKSPSRIIHATSIVHPVFLQVHPNCRPHLKPTTFLSNVVTATVREE